MHRIAGRGAAVLPGRSTAAPASYDGKMEITGDKFGRLVDRGQRNAWIPAAAQAAILFNARLTVDALYGLPYPVHLDEYGRLVVPVPPLAGMCRA